jgi:hypothetical protein
MTTTELPLRCRCGTVQGIATDLSPKTGNRIVCYCDDCQAFAHFLERDDILDSHGGTDIFQMTPSQVTITLGADHLHCMRLSEKGLMRWYTGCCKTPVGNTAASAGVPVVGLIHSFVDHAAHGRSRDDVLGAPIGFVQTRFAVGRPPPHAGAMSLPALIVRSVRLLVGAWQTGKSRPSPFFNASTRTPVVEPRVLTRAERERLRP